MTYPTLSLDIINSFSDYMQHQQPLVHCMTNEVVQSLTANILLAANMSPAMIVAPQEVEQFVSMADALLINIGTLYSARADAMLLAVQTAQRLQKPWVLDPVAIGSLNYRTSFAHKLLGYHPTVIRGNASEIMALAGLSEGGKGTDSTVCSTTALPAAEKLALTYKAIVAVTGKIDFITDGKQGWSIPWGSSLMTKVVGCGCALSAFIAGYIAKSEDHFTATACACAVYALAGQYATTNSEGSGSFLPKFIDALYNHSYQYMAMSSYEKNS